MEVMFNAVDDPEKCKFHAALYFKKFDIDKSGRLDEREFVNGMVSAFNFAGQSQVLKKLFDRYDGEDDKDDNKISYVEFIEKVLGLVPNAAGDPKSRSVLEKVRTFLPFLISLHYYFSTPPYLGDFAPPLILLILLSVHFFLRTCILRLVLCRFGQ